MSPCSWQPASAMSLWPCDRGERWRPRGGWAGSPPGGGRGGPQNTKERGVLDTSCRVQGSRLTGKTSCVADDTVAWSTSTGMPRGNRATPHHLAYPSLIHRATLTSLLMSGCLASGVPVMPKPPIGADRMMAAVSTSMRHFQLENSTQTAVTDVHCMMLRCKRMTVLFLA